MDDASTPHDDRHESGSVGPLVATIIVVVILALGGLYFFVTQAERIRAVHNQAQVNS